MKATSGPWQIWGPSQNDFEDPHYNIHNGHKSIARTGDGAITIPYDCNDLKQQKVNAALIASAPELYEALKNLCEDRTSINIGTAVHILAKARGEL